MKTQVTDFTTEELELRSYSPLDRGWFNQRAGEAVTVHLQNGKFIGGTVRKCVGSNYYDCVLEIVKSHASHEILTHIKIKDISAVTETEVAYDLS